MPTPSPGLPKAFFFLAQGLAKAWAGMAPASVRRGHLTLFGHCLARSSGPGLPSASESAGGTTTACLCAAAVAHAQARASLLHAQLGRSCVCSSRCFPQRVVHSIESIFRTLSTVTCDFYRHDSDTCAFASRSSLGAQTGQTTALFASDGLLGGTASRSSRRSQLLPAKHPRTADPELSQQAQDVPKPWPSPGRGKKKPWACAPQALG